MFIGNFSNFLSNKFRPNPVGYSFFHRKAIYNLRVQLYGFSYFIHFSKQERKIYDKYHINRVFADIVPNYCQLYWYTWLK